MLFLYLHLSSLNFCLLIIAVVVINFGLDCFTNSVLAYIHIPHIYCLFISLCWWFVNWGSKHLLVFYTGYVSWHFCDLFSSTRQHEVWAEERQTPWFSCTYRPIYCMEFFFFSLERLRVALFLFFNKFYIDWHVCSAIASNFVFFINSCVLLGLNSTSIGKSFS